MATKLTLQKTSWLNDGPAEKDERFYYAIGGLPFGVEAMIANTRDDGWRILFTKDTGRVCTWTRHYETAEAALAALQTTIDALVSDC